MRIHSDYAKLVADAIQRSQTRTAQRNQGEPGRLPGATAFSGVGNMTPTCPRCGGSMYVQPEVTGVNLRCFACSHRVALPEHDPASRLRPNTQTRHLRVSAESRRENQCACGKFIGLMSKKCSACNMQQRPRRTPDRRCLSPDCQHEWRLRHPWRQNRIRCPKCAGWTTVEISVEAAAI